LEPRVPIGHLQAHQRADIRASDLILLSMFVAFILLVSQGKIRLQFKLHMLFLFCFIISTFLSSLFGWVRFNYDPIYSLFFFLRVFEYVILPFVVQSFIKNEETLKKIFLCFLLAFSINSLWLIFQLITNHRGPLLETVNLAFYGYALISNSQPFTVGGVFLLSLLLFVIYYLFYKNSISILLIVCIALVGTALSFSRTVITAAIICLVVVFIIFIFQGEKSPKKIFFFILILGLLLSSVAIMVAASSIFIDLPFYRLDLSNAIEALYNVRIKQIWLPLLRKFSERAMLGYGVGNIGNLHQSFDEGHNYYIRLLLEVGIVGFINFAMFILILLYKLIKKTIILKPKKFDYIYTINIYLLVWMIAIIILSFAQDALQTPEIAIPTFTLIGIMNWVFNRDSALIKRRRFTAISRKIDRGATI
jgi:O-antigen ligase